MSNLKKSRREGGYRIDWEKLKNEYIFAVPEIKEETNSIRYPSIEDIAKRNKVDVSLVACRCAREKWVEKRQMYQEKVNKLHELELGAMSLRRSAKFDSDNLDRLGKMTDMFDRWCMEKEVDEERLDIKEMKTAMEMMTTMHKLHRDIMGEPINYYEFYKEKIKTERKEIEKGKAVTKSEIRDLITSIKNNKNNTKVTLDVTPDEEENMRVVTDDDRKEE